MDENSDKLLLPLQFPHLFHKRCQMTLRRELKCLTIGGTVTMAFLFSAPCWVMHFLFYSKSFAISPESKGRGNYI